MTIIADSHISVRAAQNILKVLVFLPVTVVIKTVAYFISREDSTGTIAPESLFSTVPPSSGSAYPLIIGL